MPNDWTSVPGEASAVGERLSGREFEMDRKAPGTPDQLGNTAATVLARRASEVGHGARAVANMAQAAADAMRAVGEYFRDQDGSTIGKDLETLVKRNPAPSLLAAAVAGFLVARLFNGNRD